MGKRERIEAPKAKNPKDIGDNAKAFMDLIAILRERSAWDRRQTHESIGPLIIEEAYELIDSIHNGNDDDFKKELGDILLHVFMHSHFAKERNAFDINDVIQTIMNKLIERLPSVFGSEDIDEEELMQNWEQLKKKKEGRKSALDGIPKTIPSLLRAERIQLKAARVGFEWDHKEEVWEKVDEEFQEMKDEIAKGDQEKKEEEFGDFLFALVNAARFEGIVPEEAMMKAISKFERRFKYIEKRASEINKDLNDMSLAEMDSYWDEAKENEKRQS